MGGQDHCCVVNCSNRRSNLPKGFAFHQIPIQPIARRNAWIRATGRKIGKKRGELSVTGNTKVCGAHFVSGRKSGDPTNIDYVPTLNLPFLSETPKRETNNSRRAENYTTAVQQATAMKRKTVKKSGRVLFQIDIDDIQSEVEVACEKLNTELVPLENDACRSIQSEIHDHDYHKFWVSADETVEDSTTQTIDPVLSTCSSQTSDSQVMSQSVQTDSICQSTGTQVDTFVGNSTNISEIRIRQQQKLIHDLKVKVRNLTKDNQHLYLQTFCVENLLKTDDNAQFYTGLPNILTFKALFQYFKPKAEKMTYWQGTDTKIRTDMDRGRPRKLSLENEFFAVLVRLRLGLLQEDIANRFNISVPSFSKIFNTWIRFLSLELKLMFPYPSAERVQELMPESFQKFPNTRIILDCTEVLVQKPSALKAQRETWSSYKHRNTYKALVGITPDGTVSFVSALYGGAASDKFIVNDCGVLNLIQPGDNVMADRGFEIADELQKKGAHLNIPPFRNGNFQLSSHQVETTRRIAEVRIHVERAIQRIKSFHILNGTMSLSLNIVADDIFQTCAYLTNFQTPIIKS